jgi:hypothetical protein
MIPLALALALCVGGNNVHPIPDPCVNHADNQTYYVGSKTGSIACRKYDCSDVRRRLDHDRR